MQLNGLLAIFASLDKLGLPQSTFLQHGPHTLWATDAFVVKCHRLRSPVCHCCCAHEWCFASIIHVHSRNNKCIWAKTTMVWWIIKRKDCLLSGELSLENSYCIVNLVRVVIRYIHLEELWRMNLKNTCAIMFSFFQYPSALAPTWIIFVESTGIHSASGRALFKFCSCSLSFRRPHSGDTNADTIMHRPLDFGRRGRSPTGAHNFPIPSFAWNDDSSWVKKTRSGSPSWRRGGLRVSMSFPKWLKIKFQAGHHIVKLPKSCYSPSNVAHMERCWSIIFTKDFRASTTSGRSCPSTYMPFL